MSIIVDRFNKIKSNINSNVNIIAVSKTFTYDHIKPLVDFGHIHFGENKVQEAENKWVKVKSLNNPPIQLHMIGKLQSNKAKKAVQIFDYIHSLDSEKLANALSKYEKQLNKNIKYFIQVNIGQETQKSGVDPGSVDEFYTYVTNKLNLNVIGLMAIPPADGNEDKYFKYLYEANASLELKDLSMGMSADYEKALNHKATFLRLGSSIFGNRK
jgi:pyridoxal phosphate enzyme (YggS family)